MNIIHTTTLPEQGVSHNPDIKKKVFLEKGQVPFLTNFSSAVFLPGQEVDFHVHETMTEVFYITKGKALFSTPQEDREVTAGDVVTIPAGETHKQSNPFDEDVAWIYFGVVTG